MAEVVVALDLPSADAALAMVDRLPGLRWGKVGPMLFIADGPRLVRELKARDIRVFLDLKLHDIPHAVEGAVRAAGRAGVDLATVHALAGPETLRAAAAAAADSGIRLAAVSVLTSHSPQSYGAAVGRSGVDVSQEVVRLATLARDAGVHGMVCSAHEAALVRDALGGGGWVVVPGIRPPGIAAGDQQRVADPATAVRAGATHLVVGRPVTGASDPAGVYHSIRSAAA